MHGYSLPSSGEKNSINHISRAIKLFWNLQGQVSHFVMTQRTFKWNIVFAVVLTSLSLRSLEGILMYSSCYSLKQRTDYQVLISTLLTSQTTCTYIHSTVNTDTYNNIHLFSPNLLLLHFRAKNIYYVSGK